jgi:hypothetical protein
MTNDTGSLRSVRELDLGLQGSIEITLSANTVRLLGVDGTRVSVRVPADRAIDEELVIDELPGRVRVREVERGHRLGPVRMWGRQPAPVEIDLPRDARVELQTLSGDVVASGIHGASQWSSASGDLRLELGDGAVTADSMSGDVTLDAAHPSVVAMRAVSGDVRVRAERIGELAVSTTSGSISVSSALEANAEHRLSSVSGTVELATPSPVLVETASITGDLRASGVEQRDGGRGSRTLVAGDGSVRVTLRTTSGDMRLRVGPIATEARRGQPPAVVADHQAAEDQPAEDQPTHGEAEDGAAAGRDTARLEVLHALERGELDVDAATRELELIEMGSRTDG